MSLPASVFALRSLELDHLVPEDLSSLFAPERTGVILASCLRRG